MILHFFANGAHPYTLVSKVMDKICETNNQQNSFGCFISFTQNVVLSRNPFDKLEASNQNILYEVLNAVVSST